MAMTDCASFAFPAIPSVLTGGLGIGGTTLNASGDRIGFVIQCPKAGVLDKFEFRTNAVANNPDNGIRPSFQTIDLATGFPDGTQDQFRDITGTITADTWQVPGLMTSDGTDTGTKRTVAAGELLGCVVDFVSFVASDSFQVATLGSTAPIRNQYMADGSTGAYAMNATNMPILALKYDDGTYATFTLPFWPVQNWNAIATGTGTTPDERALKIVALPLAMRTTGVWVLGDLDGTIDLVLYNAASGVIDTISLDPDVRNAGNSARQFALWPNGPHTLSAGVVYRVAVKPTSATTCYVETIEVPSSGYMQCLPGGSNLILSTRTDGGAWSDDATRRPMITLEINGIDPGSSAAAQLVNSGALVG